MPSRLPNPELRRLRAKAQLLKPMLKVGKAGVSPQFLQSVDTALQHHELIKIKFDEFKEERKELSAELAEKSCSQIILQVGHVVVLFRRQPEREPEQAPKHEPPLSSPS